MPTNFDREPAQIISFPAKVRLPMNGARLSQELPLQPSAVRVARTEFGSGWYHEAAIRDADLARKR